MMVDEREDFVHTGKRISVTMLTGGCKRQTLLERTQPYWLLPIRKLPAFRGTLIHAVAEKAAPMMRELGWLIEEHISLTVKTKSGEWDLVGTLDAYEPLRETLYDIKTLQDYAVKLTALGKQNGTWSDHVSDAYVKQLNIYRYLLQQTGDYKVARMVLQIIGFGQFVTTGHEQNIAVQKGWKFTREDYDIPDIPFVPDKTVRYWIESEGEEWYRILYLNEPAPRVPDAYKWLCKICAFKDTEHCLDEEETNNEL
jgi:hypothetical protein